MHNKALVYLQLKWPELAAEVLMAAIEKVKQMIETEQMKLGFMDQEEELLQNHHSRLAIQDSKLQLAHLYLCLARASQTHSPELSLASALKCLELVRSLYEQWGQGSEVSHLLAICDIRDKLSHRKKLEEVGV